MVRNEGLGIKETNIEGPEIEQQESKLREDPRTPGEVMGDGTTKIFDINNEGGELLSWIYVGHGEWAQMGSSGQTKESHLVLEWEDQHSIAELYNIDRDIQRHQDVITGGYPNRWGARIPVPTKWNLELLHSLLHEYDDREVVEWM